MYILSDTQVGRYFQNGYLLVSGLIPEDISQKIEERIWLQFGIDRQNPDWTKAVLEESDHPDSLACYTEEFLLAAAQLAGDDPSSFRKPNKVFGLHTFPSTGQWSWPSPHIDHAIKAHGHKTFPRAFRIAAMIFHSDVGLHGGGTIVWPESHHQIRALAESDPKRYEYMWVLNGDIRQLDLKEPIEVTPSRGDVLFYDVFCAHSGSKNVTERPRLAYNWKQ
ncbi:MAG: phytanoyl-CoA dioxygenase family protein [Candidatus Poribacteria bacterium]|jgi:hypothetical protein|nr:phytanoyl-CoA dioxygenase family protein [Candidatus Poribacteria bacterium]|tara:strand:- start:202 stop:864 length:663 start_codon:yes stop_codon:yes gene_type:complete